MLVWDWYFTVFPNRKRIRLCEEQTKQEIPQFRYWETVQPTTMCVVCYNKPSSDPLSNKFSFLVSLRRPLHFFFFLFFLPPCVCQPFHFPFAKTIKSFWLLSLFFSAVSVGVPLRKPAFFLPEHLSLEMIRIATSRLTMKKYLISDRANCTVLWWYFNPFLLFSPLLSSSLWARCEKETESRKTDTVFFSAEIN